MVNPTDESNETNIIQMIPTELQQSFQKILKCGIYKELHKRSSIRCATEFITAQKIRGISCTSQEQYDILFLWCAIFIRR